MRYLITVLVLISPIMAQELANQDAELSYRHALEVAYSDGSVDRSERVLLDLLAESYALDAQLRTTLEQPFIQTNLNKLDQSGRWPLVAQNMVYGAGLYGWAIPEVLDVKDAKWFVGSEMLSLGVSFVLTQRYTADMDIDFARAQMLRTGSALGLRYGIGTAGLFDLFEGNDGDAGLVVVMAGVPLGTWVGDRLYQSWQPNHGESWNLSLWSGMSGLLMRNSFAALVSDPNSYDLDSTWVADPFNWLGGVWEVDEIEQPEQRRWRKLRTLVDLSGYPLGLWWANRLNQERNITFGDAVFLHQAYGYGWLASMAAVDIVLGSENMDEGTFLLLSTLGATGNVFWHDRIIQKYDYTFGQSVLTALGTGAGIMAGLGIGVIAEVDESKVVEALGLAGGIAGAKFTQGILDLAADGSLAVNETGPQLYMAPNVQLDSQHQHIPGLALTITF